MNARDILFYGDQTLKQTLESVPADLWETVGATSGWTVKDVLAHLASYEMVLADVLEAAIDPGKPTPTLDGFRDNEKTFSESHVERQNGESRDTVQKEYDTAHERVMRAIEKIPPETRRTPGTIAWYGPEYSLDDFLVYNNYAHKREHSGMIRLFLASRRQQQST
ncbi:MAG: maleylpyruvate isomerase N-terminal domain-containing protein [Candidatus Kerfeldbacteria bacterium]|nr:maleylpyruvate isomerase N-terminal domain-containing protein [Candidatus Kerfeldbacteria bacterium]